MQLTSRTDTHALIRTDFSDDNAWRAVVRAVTEPQPQAGSDQLVRAFMVEIVEDRSRWEGTTRQGLLELATVAKDGYQRGDALYAYLADRRTMTEPDYPILAVNLYLDAGLSFRVIASQMAEVDTNLDIANLDFGDFSRAAASAADGVYRGF